LVPDLVVEEVNVSVVVVVVHSRNFSSPLLSMMEAASSASDADSCSSLASPPLAMLSSGSEGRARFLRLPLQVVEVDTVWMQVVAATPMVVVVAVEMTFVRRNRREPSSGSRWLAQSALS